MTPLQYKAERKAHGSQAAVGKLLDVHQVTMARRETGVMPITREAELAIRYLDTMAAKSPIQIKDRAA